MPPKLKHMSKPVVLIAEELSPATVEALGPDFEVRNVDGTDRPALLAALATAQAVLIRSATQMDAEAIEAVRRCLEGGRMKKTELMKDVMARALPGALASAPRGFSWPTAPGKARRTGQSPAADQPGPAHSARRPTRVPLLRRAHTAPQSPWTCISRPCPTLCARSPREILKSFILTAFPVPQRDCENYLTQIKQSSSFTPPG